MQRIHALIFSGRYFPAHNPIVFHIINQLKQRKGQHALRKKEHRNLPYPPLLQHAEEQERCRAKQQRKHCVVNHAVVDTQHRKSFFAQSFIFQFPGMPVTTEYRPEPESIKRFILPGCSRIFRRGHQHMMALVVFNVEMHVADCHEQNFAVQPFNKTFFVAQFMCHCYPDATGNQCNTQNKQCPIYN